MEVLDALMRKRQLQLQRYCDSVASGFAAACGDINNVPIAVKLWRQQPTFEVFFPSENRIGSINAGSLDTRNAAWYAFKRGIKWERCMLKRCPGEDRMMMEVRL